MKKRNHYLSVFYLKGWRDNSTTHGYIHRYTLGTLSHVERNVKSVGWSYKLTICPTPHAETELVEDHLSQWEHESAGPFRQLRDNHMFPVSKECRWNLCWMFLMRRMLSPEPLMMMGKTTFPALVVDMRRMLEERLGLGHKVMVRHPNSEVVAVRNTKQWIKETIETEMSRRMPDIEKMCSLHAVYASKGEASLTEKNMRLHLAPPDFHVILSDNPMIVTGSNAGNENPTEAGEADTIRWFPVSSSSFLSFSSSYPRDEVVTATKEEIDWFNSSLIRSAYKYIFTGRNDNNIASQVMTAKPKTTLRYE